MVGQRMEQVFFGAWEASPEHSVATSYRYLGAARPTLIVRPAISEEEPGMAGQDLRRRRDAKPARPNKQIAAGAGMSLPSSSVRCPP
jgi:hypothetical protein